MLLPTIVIVPVAAALAVLGAAAWHARVNRQSAVQAARDELRLAARAIELAAGARAQAALPDGVAQEVPAADLAAEAALAAGGSVVTVVSVP